jgi:surface-anchored protein
MRTLIFPAVLAVAAPAVGQVRLDGGHFDLEVETVFDTPSSVDEIELIIANEDEGQPPFPNLGELEADEAFFVPGNFRIQSGALGGIADGSDVYFVPEVQDPTTLWLGIGSEETGPGVIVNDTYTLNLINFSGPGTFVASQSSIGGPIIAIDTSDGLAGDALVASTLGDNHYDMAFDAIGTYELTFEATGTLTPAFGGGDVSAIATYTFVVPEPATAGLLGAAGMVLLRRRR